MTDPTVRADACDSIALAAFARRAQDLNHDLRTPIGTIATALELLRAGGAPFGEDDLEAFDVLQRQVARLTALAESLRDLAVDLGAEAVAPTRSG